MKNRVIKFRGLRTDTKEWVYGYLTVDSDGRYSIGNPVFTVIPESVGQFTGLLDSEGKEIYEGDVFKGNKENVAIISCNSYFALMYKEGCIYSSTFIGCDRINSEIIGNIHENPELLNR